MAKKRERVVRQKAVEARLPKDRDERSEAIRKGSHTGGRVRMI